MSSNADPGFNGYVVLYWSGWGCIANRYRNTVAVFVGRGFKMQKYRNTAVVFAPFWRGLRVNGVGEKPISGMCVKPNIFRSVLIFMLNIWGVDSKYRNTEIQQLSLCPSSGPKCPPLKNGHLGPRSVGPQTIGPRTVGPPDSWAQDRCRSPTSEMIFVKYFTHIRQI